MIDKLIERIVEEREIKMIQRIDDKACDSVKCDNPLCVEGFKVRTNLVLENENGKITYGSCNNCRGKYLLYYKKP